MSENHRIVEFNQAVDLIMKADLSGLCIENEENRDLLTFAGKMSKIDYSGESKKSGLIKQKLLKMLQNDTRELNDAELDLAAGGLNEIPDGNDPEHQK